MHAHSPVTLVLWRTETGAVGLDGHQPTSRLSERLCHEGIRWKVIKQEIQQPLLTSVSMHIITHTSTYNHTHEHTKRVEVEEEGNEIADTL